MKAVIPAAGFASRLRPLTNNCHKTMLPVGGTTMMELIVNNLRINGIRNIIIITGFKSEDLSDYVRGIANGMTVEFIHNPDFETTGNAYSLSLAASAVAGEEFILLDCDIVFEPEVMRRIVSSEYPTALALMRSDVLGPEEMKVYTSDGVTADSISKTGNPANAVGESIGIEKFSAEFSALLFETLQRRIREQTGRTEFYEASFVELAGRGEKMHLVDASDLRVMEVDFESDLRTAEKELIPEISVSYTHLRRRRWALAR